MGNHFHILLETPQANLVTGMTTPFFPASGPATRSFNGLPPKSKFLALIVGVALFGTFAGFVASLFVEPDIKREEKEVHALAQQIKALRGEIQAIDDKISRQNRKMNRDNQKMLAANHQPPPPQNPAA